MPVMLEGSCRCGAVTFSVESHTPYPYMLCYCSICRKLNGGGGYTINILAVADTLKTNDGAPIKRISVEKDGNLSPMHRAFCANCGTALWGWHPDYPDLLHPFASSIDSDLPKASERTHIMLGSKASWVEPDIRSGDKSFDDYPDQSIEDWHRSRNLWIE